MLTLAALLVGAVDVLSTRSYDAAGNSLTAVDAAGYATTFAVDASGQVAGKTGPQPGEAWSFEYDVFGQLKKKTLARGATAQAGWKGAVWSYEYGLADGTTIKETGPDGYTTSRWYNARHQLLKEVRTDVGSSRSSSNEWVMTQEWSGPYLKTRVEKEGTWTKTLSRPSYDHRGRVLEQKEEFAGVEGSAGYSYTTSMSVCRR